MEWLLKDYPTNIIYLALLPSSCHFPTVTDSRFLLACLWPPTRDVYGCVYRAVCFLLQNAFFSMYLLNNFSTVVDTAVKFSEIVGYTHRYIAHFLSVCCLLMQEDAYK